jgi:hypothetical protein
VFEWSPFCFTADKVRHKEVDRFAPFSSFGWTDMDVTASAVVGHDHDTPRTDPLAHWANGEGYHPDPGPRIVEKE